MKNRRRVFKRFEYRECDAFAEYLRKQSLSGWHFKEWKMGLIFEKGEPEDIVYDVEVFPKGTEMDTQPEEDAVEFAEYCEAAGWKFLDGKRKFCIFRRIKEDAVPIVTQEERMQNVWKAELKMKLSRMAPLLIIAIQNWFSIFHVSPNLLLSNTMLFVLLAITVLAGECILEFIGILIWKERAKRRLSAGEQIYYGRKIGTEYMGAGLLILGMLVLAFLEHQNTIFVSTVIMFLLVVLGSALIEELRLGRANNWMIQLAGGSIIVFAVVFLSVWLPAVLPDHSQEECKSADELPLIQTDYMNESGETASFWGERQESILGKGWNCSVVFVTDGDKANGVLPMETDISYHIYESKYEWVLDIFWANEIKSKYLDLQDCTEEWNAKQALCEEKKMGVYKIRYPGKVISIFVTPKLEESQMLRVREKLTNGWEE